MAGDLYGLVWIAANSIERLSGLIHVWGTIVDKAIIKSVCACLYKTTSYGRVNMKFTLARVYLHER